MTHDDQHLCYLGSAIAPGDYLASPFAITREARAKHLYLIGQTGTGKSTALANLIAQDLTAGEGIAILDPHAQLAEHSISLIPSQRAHELVYLNPKDLGRPVGFNPIERVHADQRAKVAGDMVAAFVHIYGEELVGPRSQAVLRNSLRALMDTPGTTLFAIPRLLRDEAYRERILRRVADPFVLAYWRQTFAGYDAAFAAQVVDPILNKLDDLLSPLETRHIIAQPNSAFSVRKIMDEGRILIVNLSGLAEQSARLLGAFLVTAIAQAALSREDTREDERRPFHLYADEFQNFATDSFDIIMSQARKFRLSLTLAHQYLDQLPPRLRSAVFGNAATIAAFRLGGTDAPFVARHLSIESPQRLQELAQGHAVIKTLIDNEPSDAFHVALDSPPEPINPHPEKLIANARIRFGRDRAKIEKKIARFLV